MVLLRTYTVDLPAQNVSATSYGSTPTPTIVGGASALVTPSTAAYVEMDPTTSEVSIGNGSPAVMGFGPRHVIEDGYRLGDPNVGVAFDLVSYGYRAKGGSVGPGYDGAGSTFPPLPTVYPIVTTDVSGWSYGNQTNLGDLPLESWGWTSHRLNTSFSFGSAVGWILDPASMPPGYVDEPGAALGLSPSMWIDDYPWGTFDATQKVRIAYLAIRLTVTIPAPVASIEGVARGDRRRFT